jgi:hypothetical protein
MSEIAGSEQLGNEQIFIGVGQEYFIGSSSSPHRVIVVDIDIRGQRVFFAQYPYKKLESQPLTIFRHLAFQGTTTRVKTYGRRGGPEIENLQKLLTGEPGRTFLLEDEQPVRVRIKTPDGLTDAWHDFEAKAPRFSIGSMRNDGRELSVYCKRGEVWAVWTGLASALTGTGYTIISVEDEP